MGPNAKIIYIAVDSHLECNTVKSWMLIIVMANPIQFTMVNAVPLFAASALPATSVENKGESAITTIPQNNKNPRSSKKEA